MMLSESEIFNEKNIICNKENINPLSAHLGCNGKVNVSI